MEANIFCILIPRQRRFVPYWVNTSSNDIIENLISKGDANIKMNLVDLIQGRIITKPIREDISSREIDENPNKGNFGYVVY